MGAGLLLGMVQERTGRLEADMESLEAHTAFDVLPLAQVDC